MKIINSFILFIVLLITSPAWAQEDISLPVSPSDSYQLRITTGTPAPGEASTLPNQLCIYRVDVNPQVLVQCYRPAAPATEFPEGFTLEVVMAFSVPPLTEPEFRATAENTSFTEPKVSELSVNKLTLTWPVPARPTLAP